MNEMEECYGRNFILNGELQSDDQFNSGLVYEGDSVYEVIRVMKGNPVFFYDHMERLEASARMQGREILADPGIIRKDLIKLIKAEKRKDINLKIVFNYNKDVASYLIYFIEPVYPSEVQYRIGVKGILFHAERKDPESKVINHRLRSSIYHMLILEGGYEALLVNSRNQITEGSRSNIFFLKEDTLITAPDELILNGITRKHILRICDENSLRVEFRCIDADSIGEYDAVFMTGTSPMVLPFNKIDAVPFNVQVPLITMLRSLYVEKAEESVHAFVRNN
jgi:branched-chain amino acid aminotransferase